MAASHEKFNNAIVSAKIPILILDNKWHRIFGKMNPTQEIKDLEKEKRSAEKENKYGNKRQYRIMQKLKIQVE